jgi:uncharacterized protein (UPF0335 family)/ribosome modulation factor
MADPLSSASPQRDHNGRSPTGDATPGLMREWIAREEELAERRRQLSKDTKDHHQEIEKTGLPLKAWKSFLKDREEAGTIRQRIFEARNRLLEWDLKPVGIQASMDLSTSAGSPELNVHELKRVDNEGFDAGSTGKKRSVNPYTPGTEAAQRFDTAWLRGQAEIASMMGTGADNGEKRGRGRPKGSTNKPKDQGSGAAPH